VYKPPTGIFFYDTCVGGLYAWLFYVIIPILFLYFCHSAIPTSCYIFNGFLLLVCVIFGAAGAWCLPSHSCRSLSLQGSIYGPLTQVLATLSVLAEESLTQASVQTPSQTLLWMDDKASSPCLKTWGTHRSRH